MSGRDSYEKENTSANTRLAKLYLGVVGLVVGLLTVYQSVVGVTAPFGIGVALTVGSGIYIGWWFSCGD